MKEPTKDVGVENINSCKPVTIYTASLVICLVFLLLTFSAVQAQAEWPYVVPSKDGTPISYEIYGTGEPTLVFVHGWSCDARYWRAQLSHFSKNHRVVTLDLAGHGHSGTTRSKYTMLASPIIWNKIRLCLIYSRMSQKNIALLIKDVEMEF